MHQLLIPIDLNGTHTRKRTFGIMIDNLRRFFFSIILPARLVKDGALVTPSLRVLIISGGIVFKLMISYYQNKEDLGTGNFSGITSQSLNFCHVIVDSFDAEQLFWSSVFNNRSLIQHVDSVNSI